MKFSKGPQVAVAFIWQGGSLYSSELTLSDTFSCTGADATLLDWLAHYVEGTSLPLRLIAGKSFSERALQALQKIPFGQTISYLDLATRCGEPKGARAAGNACHNNPFPLLIPCHRVIYSNGKIGGFAINLEIKRRLLAFEKVSTI